MLPLFFGSKQRRLFGAYEPAAVRSADVRAALLCGSWGVEYTNAHRTMRLLSKRLAAAGFDTLRFDYFGAGDSGGETTEADLDGWKDDIQTALRELKDMSGATHVAAIGLRLGATLLAETVPRLSAEIQSAVLWDPILSGADYLQALLCPIDNHYGKTSDSAAYAESKAGLASELGGLLVSSAFVRGLADIDLSTYQAPASMRMLAVFTETGLPDGAFSGFFDSGGEVARLQAPPPWKDAAERDEGLPVEVCERILKWLG
ncbi:serine aminopeptidase domain-containing protein [Bradyrhizobium sp. ORS 86]|uniref:serine aminopeptidase domain-containing protein n=1 Tax=Bradyrhizobium sp. ORS 86 TaxID=1685970 RepID=UPI00388DC654